eukprot:SAG11_NODE_2603_length_3179_cov_35.599675_2_plen_206_part_00
MQEAFLCAALRGGLQEALAVAGRGTPPPIFSDATPGRASLLVCSLRAQTHKAATRAGACRALPGRQRGTLMRVLVALSALGLSAISTVVKLLTLCVEDLEAEQTSEGSSAALWCGQVSSVNSCPALAKMPARRDATRAPALLGCTTPSWATQAAVACGLRCCCPPISNDRWGCSRLACGARDLHLGWVLLAPPLCNLPQRGLASC